MLLLAAAAAIAVFLFINWRSFAAETTVNFLFFKIDMPMGVLLLAVTAPLIAGVAIYMGVRHGTMLVEYRRQAKELEAQRALADSAEGSRFTELSVILKDELAKLDRRLDASFDSLRTEVRDAERSIAASLGEMDDRLQRAAQRNPDTGDASTA